MEGVKVKVGPVANAVPVPLEFEYHSTVHSEVVVAVRVVEDALSHVTTSPPEIGAEGNALTVMFTGFVDIH
jgi:hypothetical protein